PDQTFANGMALLVTAWSFSSARKNVPPGGAARAGIGIRKAVTAAAEALVSSSIRLWPSFSKTFQPGALDVVFGGEVIGGSVPASPRAPQRPSLHIAP